MKNLIKYILRICPRKWMLRVNIYKKFLAKYTNESKFSIIRRVKIIMSSPSMDYMEDYSRQFKKIVEKISICETNGFIYPYDPFVVREFNRTPICSITVDFEKVLNSNLDELKEYISHSSEICFKNRELDIIQGIELLGDRVSSKCSAINSRRGKELNEMFPSILYRKPLNLDEALQKILFYNALFWQMGHFHIGLGRLDLILWNFYDSDIKGNILTEIEAKEKISDFIKVLGKDTVAKSPTLVGDTGQYIMLGGVDSDGNNVANNLTLLFLDLLTELKIPDPKLIIRVNNNTPNAVWEKSIDCIKTGIGSPLFMDEKPIMDKMIKFGYNQGDVWNVGTSACWEPLIIGKSFDQNNPFRAAAAIRPLNTILLSGHDYLTFEELYTKFKEEYKKELSSVVEDIAFDCSPLFSLFFDECLKRERDFTDGGAVYSYHGAQVVSFPNTINALLNIKHLIYEKKLYSLEDCRKAILCDYEGMEDFRLLLQTTGKKFGSTDREVVDITNDLICFTGESVKTLRCNGERVKVGFSSPNYIYKAKIVQASLDGRKSGEPFAVHVSPISSQIDISEILDFSSLLNYGENCINGNVVDFILPASYIKQPVKFVGILKNSCAKGFFELQLNVMDKATLIDAKAHPEKYPNLIVRVWGFSAYFNDLPDEFKDNLIRRAEVYEAA